MTLHSSARGPQQTGSVDSIAEHSGLDADSFKAVFRNHPAGVAVITADAGNGPVGLTATSVFSVSAQPPLLVFSVSGQSSSAPTILAADTVVVHLLGSEQLDLATLCATSGIDRFADTSIWDRLITGEPYFPSAQSWIRGKVIERMDAGGSTVIAIHALQAGISDDVDSGEPLVYHNRTWHRLGEHSRIDA
ncbi:MULTISPECIES: flavin reductase family protein [unclassified Agreia]|uniref:flavin reductase family protein n=1 Tax=unclassified Agreia TaxID=2641148 RepID=UPI0009EC2AD9|nr:MULTISPECIES: flavin reductase family protein [Microbacteriaceae]PPF65481.1 flavin reductase [Clavibacter michiganensis]